MNHQGLYWQNGRTLFRREPQHLLRRLLWLAFAAAAAALASWSFGA